MQFEAFWFGPHPVRSTSASHRSTLVLLLFTAPIPPEASLLAIGKQDDGREAGLLYAPGRPHDSHPRTWLAFAVPPAWREFETYLRCVETGRAGPALKLTFSTSGAAEASHLPDLATIGMNHGRISLAFAGANEDEAVAVLQSRRDARGRILPVAHAGGADGDQLKAWVETTDPYKEPYDDVKYSLILSSGASRRNVRLRQPAVWHIRRNLLASRRSVTRLLDGPAPDDDIAEPARPIPGRNRTRFEIKYPAPGDFIVLFPEVSTGLALSRSDAAGFQASFAVPASSWHALQLDLDLEPVPSDLHGEPLSIEGLPTDRRLLKMRDAGLHRLEEWITERVSGPSFASEAIGRFAGLLQHFPGDGLKSAASRVEEYALIHALVDRLGERLPGDSMASGPVAASRARTELAQLISPRRQHFFERLTNAAVAEAASDGALRLSLLQRIGGNDDPFLPGRAFSAALDARLRADNVDRAAAYRWLEEADVEAQAALLSLGGVEPKPGEIIHAGLRPDFDSLGSGMLLDTVLRLNEVRAQSSDPAVADMIAWACEAALIPSGRASMSDTAVALGVIQPARESVFQLVAVPQAAAWLDALQLEALTEPLRAIRAALGERLPPRFDRRSLAGETRTATDDYVRSRIGDFPMPDSLSNWLEWAPPACAALLAALLAREREEAAADPIGAITIHADDWVRHDDPKQAIMDRAADELSRASSTWAREIRDRIRRKTGEVEGALRKHATVPPNREEALKRTAQSRAFEIVRDEIEVDIRKRLAEASSLHNRVAARFDDERPPVPCPEYSKRYSDFLGIEKSFVAGPQKKLLAGLNLPADRFFSAAEEIEMMLECVAAFERGLADLARWFDDPPRAN